MITNLIVSTAVIYILIGCVVEIVRDTSGGTRKAVLRLLKQAAVWPFLFKSKE